MLVTNRYKSKPDPDYVIDDGYGNSWYKTDHEGCDGKCGSRSTKLDDTNCKGQISREN